MHDASTLKVAALFLRGDVDLLLTAAERWSATLGSGAEETSRG